MSKRFVHYQNEEDAARIALWFAKSGGIRVWNSEDLSYPGMSITTPAKTASGNPYMHSQWRYSRTPALEISDPDLVGIETRKVHKIVPVHTRPGSNGLSVKLTNDSAERYRQALAEAGDDAIGYPGTTNDGKPAMIITLPSAVVSLSQWISDHAAESLGGAR